MNLLQPLTDLTTIEARLDATDELGGNDERFFAMQAGLKSLMDVDHLVTHLIQIPKKASLKHSEQALNRIIMLRTILRNVKQVRLSVLSCKNPVLRTIATALSDPRLVMIEKELDTYINQDITFAKQPLSMMHQRCYAVKAGTNGLLDIARQTYKETCDDVLRLIDGVSSKYGLPLKTVYLAKTGYSVECDLQALEGGIDTLPIEFINSQVSKRKVCFTMLELKKYNDRIRESIAEIYLMSDKTINNLHSYVRGHIACLYRLAEALALLDMLASFTIYKKSMATVRPIFGNELIIKGGRHAMREAIYQEKFTPNDTYTTNESHFQVVTGINMSGKSTYLRQIALLHILAHAGMYVPATYSAFRLTRQLFSRLCSDDGEESSWMTEMRDMAYILDHVQDDSLVLVDELGRGTNHEGYPIVYSIAKQLLQTKAFAFFVTHFHDVAKAIIKLPGVVSLHLESVLDQEGYHYTYTVKDGAQEDGHYGLWMAKVVGIPEVVLERARVLAQELEKRHERWMQ